MSIDPHENERRPTLTPPQLRLSSLFWVVALLCAVFATLGTAGPYAAFALILLILAILAHVSGNALGTQLRDNGNQPIDENGARLSSDHKPHKPTAKDYAPTTKLGDRQSLGVIVFALTVTGALVGAAGGGTLLVILNWQQITIHAVILAVLFCGVLGGIGGFATSSLVKVAYRAQAQAAQHARQQKG